MVLWLERHSILHSIYLLNPFLIPGASVMTTTQQILERGIEQMISWAPEQATAAASSICCNSLICVTSLM